MASLRFEIDADIRRAHGPPAALYTDASLHDVLIERVFAPSWQLVADADAVRVPGQVYPMTLLEGSLNAPLLLTRDEQDRLHGLSNVCTHRGMLVCETPGHEKSLRCRYHGRRFTLDGRLHSMPEFEDVEGFPAAADDLPAVAHAVAWNRLIFASLRPQQAFDDWIGPVVQRLAWLPLRELRFDASRSRDYLVRANWALYCENYLEGFHIPYVHASLSDVLDYGGYRTELFDTGSAQIGQARGGEPCFAPPAGHVDHGQPIAAYYYWLFPNLMLNFYPWGLSINVVKPLAVDRTRVSFLTYLLDETKSDTGAGAGLDRVEREDEAIVEAVQRGMASRLYGRARYSPTREQGTHHFHRLLAATLAQR